MPKKTTLNLDDDVLSIIVKYQKKQNIEFFNDAVNQIIRTFKEQPQSDVPLEAPSLQERAKTNPALAEALKNIQEPSKALPIPPCNFASKETWIDPKTKIQYVFCRHPKYTTKGKPEAKITIGGCIEHWKARQWGFQKREKEREYQETEGKLVKEIPAIKKLEVKNSVEKLLDGTLPYFCEQARQEMQIDDLPCIKECVFDCPFTKCMDRVQRLQTIAIETGHKEVKKLEEEYKAQGKEITWR